MYLDEYFHWFIIKFNFEAMAYLKWFLDEYFTQPLASQLHFNIYQIKYPLRNRFKYSNVSPGSFDPHRESHMEALPRSHMEALPRSHMEALPRY